MAELATSLGMDGLRRLTLDQVEFLISGGKVDRHADPDTRAVAEVQRMWEAQQAAKAAEAAASPARDRSCDGRGAREVARGGRGGEGQWQAGGR